MHDTSMKPITTEALCRQTETDIVLLLNLLMEEQLKKTCHRQVFFLFLSINITYNPQLREAY